MSDRTYYPCPTCGKMICDPLDLEGATYEEKEKSNILKCSFCSTRYRIINRLEEIVEPVQSSNKVEVLRIEKLKRVHFIVGIMGSTKEKVYAKTDTGDVFAIPVTMFPLEENFHFTDYLIKDTYHGPEHLPPDPTDGPFITGYTRLPHFTYELIEIDKFLDGEVE